MTTVNKLMVGVAVGAILGILYAPDKGYITRRKLSRTGNELKDKLNKLKTTINDKIESLKEDVEELAYDEMLIAADESSANSSSL